MEFDDIFKDEISKYAEVINHLPSDEVTPVSTEEICSAIKVCKRNKSPGDDGINYEHVLFGGQLLCYTLGKLYTRMLQCAYIPDGMKTGVIVTLHKGGRKCKTNPDNYRAITLTSALLKLFERVICNRIEVSEKLNISRLQGGFQKQMGCAMTSFMLKECIYYAREMSSKLYVGFLDVKKAFDRVWHDGLFVKLHELGIDQYIVKTLMNMYSGMSSYVLHGGFRSQTFLVHQGTRQGGVSSPLCYIMYINELLNLLVSSGYGATIHQLSCCCPTVADDMVLVSYTKIRAFKHD